MTRRSRQNEEEMPIAVFEPFWTRVLKLEIPGLKRFVCTGEICFG